jgi:TolB-like protein
VSNTPSFLAELKRRNVYKVAVAYGVVGWLIVQVATSVLPTFHAPEWVAQTLIMLVVLGFPVALIIAWAFEMTPEGIKRTENVSPDALLPQWSKRKFAAVFVTLALIAAGLLAWQRLRPTAPSPVEGGAPSTQSILEKSIAVLPFDNLSDDKSNAYFCEGVQDEILTRLAKVADLKVISRTSTQHFKSSPDNLPQIARQLGVAHILEGSVQKANNQVRVTVQLIKATSDAHLWAETFDRKLTDIFAVETEIAKTIAETLQAKLTGSETKAIAEKPTTNMAAYDAYLRGLSIEQSHWSYGAWEEAVAAYTRAVELDPGFALAWSHLARVRSLLYVNGEGRSRNSADNVKEAADRAMALQPDLGEAWIAQGDYSYRVARRFSDGLQAYGEARRRLPNNSLVFMSMANVERRLGSWQDAETHYRKAAELDPRNLQIFEALGAYYGFLHQFDQAHATFDSALAIAPMEEDLHARKAFLFLDAGRLEDADQELALVPRNSTNEVVRDTRIVQAIYEHRFDDGIALASKVLEDTKPNEPPGADAISAMIQLGNLRTWTNRPDEAKTAFGQAIQAIKPTPGSIVPADGAGLPLYLAAAYAGLGEKEKALAQARHAVEQYNDDAVNKPDAEAILAQIQARFGDVESAMAALPHLLEVPAGLTRSNLRNNPLWDPLRKDPRFTKLCQEGNR